MSETELAQLATAIVGLSRQVEESNELLRYEFVTALRSVSDQIEHLRRDLRARLPKKKKYPVLPR